MLYSENTEATPRNKSALHKDALFILFLLVASYFIDKAIVACLVLVYVAVNLLSPGLNCKRRMLIQATPLIMIFLIACHGIFTHETYNVAQDLFYILQAPLVFLTGFIAATKIEKPSTVFNVFIVGAILMSASLMSHFLINPDLLFGSRYEIREEVGRGHALIPLGLSLILCAWLQNGELKRQNSRFHFFAFLFTLIALLLTFSRGHWITVLIPAVVSYFVFGASFVKRVFPGLLVVSLSGIAFLLLSDLGLFDISDNFVVSTFQALIDGAREETNIQDHSNFRDITLNWRGYESYQALSAFLSGSLIQHIVGQGAGTLVDLGFVQRLGSLEDRYIPIIHHGYLYVLLKTGLVGLVFYLTFLISPLINLIDIRKQGNAYKFSTSIQVSCCIIILISTFFMTGLFNQQGSFAVTMLLGCTSGMVVQSKLKRELNES